MSCSWFWAIELAAIFVVFVYCNTFGNTYWIILKEMYNKVLFSKYFLFLPLIFTGPPCWITQRHHRYFISLCWSGPRTASGWYINQSISYWTHVFTTTTLNYDNFGRLSRKRRLLIDLIWIYVDYKGVNSMQILLVVCQWVSPVQLCVNFMSEIQFVLKSSHTSCWSWTYYITVINKLSSV